MKNYKWGNWMFFSGNASLRRIRILFLFILAAFYSVTLIGCGNRFYKQISKSPESHEILIGNSLTDDLEIRNCHYIPAVPYPGSYFVAGEIYGGKMKGYTTGVWVIDNLEKPEKILAVTQPAIAFSSVPSTKKEMPKATFNRREVRAVKKYVENKHYR